jgi:hypothetical protein
MTLLKNYLAGFGAGFGTGVDIGADPFSMYTTLDMMYWDIRIKKQNKETNS